MEDNFWSWKAYLFISGPWKWYHIQWRRSKTTKKIERRYIKKCPRQFIMESATQKQFILEVWWLGHSHDVGNYVHKYSRCAEIKNFSQNKLHTWPRETEPWACVYMNHMYVNNIGLSYFFSGRPEVVCVLCGKWQWGYKSKVKNTGVEVKSGDEKQSSVLLLG